MKALVTGGAGFIGSNFVRWLLAQPDRFEVVTLDKLTYAGNKDNLRGLEEEARHRFIQGDVANPEAVSAAISGCSAVVHFAAETHVDRSIVDSDDFLRTNVLGTQVLLEAARRAKAARFVHISTDEVYGSLATGAASEDSPMAPNSPYAASKAGADHLARAYHITYGLPVVTARASNNFGPYQFPEKFLPLMITNALDGLPVPIYGDGQYVREWLYVGDFCEAIGLLLRRGAVGEAYNVGTGDDRVNLDLAETVLRKMGKPLSLLKHVQDRPGHDRRYAIKAEKIRKLGWAPRRSFDETLEETISWYRSHESWWRPLKEKAQGTGVRVS